MVTFFLFLVYPFRMVYLLTSYRNFRWLKKFMVIQVRLVPGLLMFFISCLFLVFFDVYVIQYYLDRIHMETQYELLTNLFQDFSLHLIKNNDLNSYHHANSTYESLQRLISSALFIVMLLAYLYYVALHSELFQHAQFMEFNRPTCQQEEYQEIVNQL